MISKIESMKAALTAAQEKIRKLEDALMLCPPKEIEALFNALEKIAVLEEKIKSLEAKLAMAVNICRTAIAQEPLSLDRFRELLAKIQEEEK